MNKTLCVNNLNSTSVNFTEYKAEEQNLSMNIYRNLHALTFYHKPSDEFLLHFKQDMFLKPNTKAFIHIYHFLFVTLDEKEFKKRFNYWPVQDKTSETNFRTASINYLNHLNEKHKMGFDLLKLHLVVLPGGHKFMKVLLEITVLTMREVVQRNGYPINKINIDMKNFSKQLKETKIHLQNTIKLKEKIEKNTRACRAGVESISTLVVELLGPSFTASFNRHFLAKWIKQIDHMIEMELMDPVQKVVRLNSLIEKMNTIINDKLEERDKNCVEFNHDDIINCQQKLMSKCSKTICVSLSNIIQMDGNINFDNLFNTFDYFLPAILEYYSQVKYPTVWFAEQKLKMIEEYTETFNSIERRMVTCKQALNRSNTSAMVDFNNQNRSMFANYKYMTNIIQTPPIGLVKRKGPIDGDDTNQLSIVKRIAMFEEDFIRDKISTTNKVTIPLRINQTSNIPRTPTNLAAGTASTLLDSKKLLNDLHKKNNQLFQKTNQTAAESSWRSILIEPPAFSSTLVSINDGSVGPLSTSSATVPSSTINGHQPNYHFSFTESNKFNGQPPLPAQLYAQQMVETTMTTIVSPDAIVYQQKKCQTNAIIQMENQFRDMQINSASMIQTSPTGRFNRLNDLRKNDWSIVPRLLTTTVVDDETIVNTRNDDAANTAKGNRNFQNLFIGNDSLLNDESMNLSNVSDTILNDIIP